MNLLDRLINDLNSSNHKHKIEVIEFIGIESDYKELVPVLLEMLIYEQDIKVLNALAISLGKLRYNKAVPILMEYIRNPNFKNIRGTFIYALKDLDCREYFMDFVYMICEGNFEVYSHSFTVFESIVDDVNYELKLEAKIMLKKQQKIELSLPAGKDPQFDRINFVNKAIELLN